LFASAKEIAQIAMRGGHAGSKSLIVRHNKLCGAKSRQRNTGWRWILASDLAADRTQWPPFHPPQWARAAELHTPLRAPN